VRGLVERTLAAGDRGPAAAAETLFREVLGDETWAGLPEEMRRTIIANGPAILADLRGDYLLDVDPSALANIDKPTLLVTAADSPPAHRRAREGRGRHPKRTHGAGRRRSPDQSGRSGRARVRWGGSGLGAAAKTKPGALAPTRERERPWSTRALDTVRREWVP
jgi:hypothetical protein